MAARLLNPAVSSHLIELFTVLCQLILTCIVASRADAAVGQRDQEKVSLRVAETLKSVADLELMQAPGLPFIIPKEYSTLPRLTGEGARLCLKQLCDFQSQ